MATMTAVKTETAPAAAAPAPADGQLSLGEFADVNERRALLLPARAPLRQGD